MPNIQLPTGKVMFVSDFEWLFVLKESEIDTFYQNCIADDLGVFIENPFSNRTYSSSLVEEDTELEDILN